LLIVMIAKRKKHRQDKGLPAFHPAPAKTEVNQSKSTQSKPQPDNRLPPPAKTEVNQSKSTQVKLTSPAIPPGSPSETQANPTMAANKVVTAPKGGPQPLPQPVATATKDGPQPVATATKGGSQPVVAAAKSGSRPAATAAKGEVSQVI
jgi:hypothetical protein